MVLVLAQAAASVWLVQQVAEYENRNRVAQGTLASKDGPKVSACYTYVYEFTGGQWKIIHHLRQPCPTRFERCRCESPVRFEGAAKLRLRLCPAALKQRQKLLYVT
jgi:hypothetical protein